MSYKKFLLKYAVLSVLIVTLIAAINYYIDIYGVFRGKKNRQMYINERTSKYLFSQRYIPENFEGFIIGPSLSANLNPQAIKDYKVYNASIMGANISELNYLVDNLIEKGKMKFAIICLGPYLTKDHGKKSASIDPKEYYGALGSTNLLKTYLLYAVRKYNIAPHRYAPHIYNAVGWNNFELEMQNLNSKKAIEEKVAIKDYGSTDIDTIAYAQLGHTIEKLRKNNIKVIGYFSPVPYQLYQLGKTDYEKFEARISSLFNDQDILMNLNDEKYKAVNDDYNTFIDHGHLSAKGQAFVLDVLDSTLKKNIPPSH
ncbi:MAG: hypothetical protein ABJA78_09785 [Ferruginibacter sp.]